MKLAKENNENFELFKNKSKYLTGGKEVRANVSKKEVQSRARRRNGKISIMLASVKENEEYQSKLNSF